MKASFLKPSALRQSLSCLTAAERALLERLLMRTHLLEGWARKYLPAYFTHPSSGLHRWLTQRLQMLHKQRGTRLAVIAPRGAAKSTWSSLVYPLWSAVHAHEPYIMIASDTITQAAQHLQGIKAELEDNTALARAYPSACGAGPEWRQERIRLRNGVVIEALGTGSKIRGRRNRADRPSLIVVDDPENDEHVTSPLQREHSAAWFARAASNAGTPQTNIVVLGTALHRDCLIMKLTRTPGWECHTFKALDHWPDRMDLWQEWEDTFTHAEDPDHEVKARAFYEANRQEMDRGATLLWPEREPLYHLMALRVTIGQAAFESEKRSSPVNPEACEWPEEYFDRPGFWFEKWPVNLSPRVIALDPSKGKDSQKGDFSAYVLAALDRTGTLYVEADLKRRDMSQIVADGVEHMRQFQPDAFGIEVNQFQELFASEFMRIGRKEILHFPIVEIENTENKLVRIRRLTSWLSQRKLRFKSRSAGTTELVQQMRDFPTADHDDGPDALETVIRVMCGMMQPIEKVTGRLW